MSVKGMDLMLATQSVLEDAKCYLNQISASDYRQSIDLLQGSSIGQHTRHFVEFYQCLIAQQPHGFVNYDLRQRNMSIEQDPCHAISAIEVILTHLEKLTYGETIRHFSSMQSKPIASSLQRELLYNVEHTIHHLAIIRIGLQLINPQFKLPSNFGVAPSTVASREAVGIG